MFVVFGVRGKRAEFAQAQQIAVFSPESPQAAETNPTTLEQARALDLHYRKSLATGKARATPDGPSVTEILQKAQARRLIISGKFRRVTTLRSEAGGLL